MKKGARTHLPKDPCLTSIWLFEGVSHRGNPPPTPNKWRPRVTFLGAEPPPACWNCFLASVRKQKSWVPQNSEERPMFRLKLLNWWLRAWNRAREPPFPPPTPPPPPNPPLSPTPFTSWQRLRLVRGLDGKPKGTHGPSWQRLRLVRVWGAGRSCAGRTKKLSMSLDFSRSQILQATSHSP